MKTFGILILIPIMFTLEIVITVCTLTIYLVANGNDFLTKKLIDKL